MATNVIKLSDASTVLGVAARILIDILIIISYTTLLVYTFLWRKGKDFVDIHSLIFRRVETLVDNVRRHFLCIVSTQKSPLHWHYYLLVSAQLRLVCCCIVLVSDSRLDRVDAIRVRKAFSLFQHFSSKFYKCLRIALGTTKRILFRR